MRGLGVFLGLCALYLGMNWMESASNKALTPVGVIALVVLLWQGWAIYSGTWRARR